MSMVFSEKEDSNYSTFQLSEQTQVPACRGMCQAIRSRVPRKLAKETQRASHRVPPDAAIAKDGFNSLLKNGDWVRPKSNFDKLPTAVPLR